MNRSGAVGALPANSRAYQHIKARLIDGDFEAGSRMPIDGIATSLKISRQPVMEALRLLSAEGYVEIKPQVGTIVADPDTAEILDFFTLFSAIEGAATALAAERCQTRQLAEAREVSNQIGALLEMEPGEFRGERYRTLNRVFHSCIHRMSETAVVEEMVSGMYDRADFYVFGRSAHNRLSEIVESRHSDHEAILTAIEDQDAQAAKGLAIQHVIVTVNLMKSDAAALSGVSRRSGSPQK